MKRRGATLGEVVTLLSILVMLLVAIAATTRRDRATAEVQATAAGSPEAIGTYEIHILATSGLMTGEATRIRNALTTWLQQNPGKKVISVIRTSGESGSEIVVLALKEGK